MNKSILLSLAALPTLSGCASIIEGSSQEVVINTNPPGADCSLDRQGISIGHVNPTPGAATIKKTKYDIQVVCKKPGFVDTTYFVKSGSAGATWGNVLAGGGIGWAIDSAAGADNHYESPMNITLLPVGTSSVKTTTTTTAVPEGSGKVVSVTQSSTTKPSSSSEDQAVQMTTQKTTSSNPRRNR